MNDHITFAIMLCHHCKFSMVTFYHFFLDEVTTMCLFVSDILENNVAVLMSNISFLLCLIFAVVVFITEYVVKMVTVRHICCPLCLAALICSKEEAEKMLLLALQNCKRWGNLINSSSDVVSVCLQAEKVFSALLCENPDSIFHIDSVQSKISNSVLKHFFLQSN